MAERHSLGESSRSVELPVSFPERPLGTLASLFATRQGATRFGVCFPMPKSEAHELRRRDVLSPFNLPFTETDDNATTADRSHTRYARRSRLPMFPSERFPGI
jgi:hypothetical protein